MLLSVLAATAIGESSNYKGSFIFQIEVYCIRLMFRPVELDQSKNASYGVRDIPNEDIPPSRKCSHNTFYCIQSGQDVWLCSFNFSLWNKHPTCTKGDGRLTFMPDCLKSNRNSFEINAFSIVWSLSRLFFEKVVKWIRLVVRQHIRI